MTRFSSGAASGATDGGHTSGHTSININADAADVARQAAYPRTTAHDEALFGQEDAAPSARRRILHGFEWFAGHATRWAGSPLAFCLAGVMVLIWAVTGPIFGYSETWQLVINTATTIITFLMVFLIQQAQNKDALAMHLKLNELLASHRHASSRLVAIEDLDEEDLKRLAAFYRQLSELAERENDIERTHGLDDALQTHAVKRRAQQEKEQGEPVVAGRAEGAED
ncbi:low affinity iron permease family protein [Cupriavidus sp. AU9028]|uniref:low affinity iron permease family protein n=1 Tax=Cupriavidus sp. AU9028 TaxID=2871157 RepID=UPI001C93DB19|nr:low affinity iron permease family protein [Cupriavidus sp. AU9028]MBY4896091.1 low affinity iron permease family protein [Cupriavidus sp. AU9028]